MNESCFRNEELEITLKHDVVRLNKYIKADGPPEAGLTPLRKVGEPEEVYDLRVSYVLYVIHFFASLLLMLQAMYVSNK